MAKTTEKTATQTANPGVNAAHADLPDFSTWSEEQTGFAPYWNPSENGWFYARLIDKDERDSEFVRYLMQAGVDTPCKRGPAESAEDVLVRKGDFFTISVYYSLQGMFELYLEMAQSGSLTPEQSFMRVMAKDKSKTKTGQKVWNWQVLVAPTTKQLADGYRAKLRQLGAGAKQARAEFAPVPSDL